MRQKGRESRTGRSYRIVEGGWWVDWLLIEGDMQKVGGLGSSSVPVAAEWMRERKKLFTSVF